MKRTFIFLGFIILLTIPIILPFLRQGYPETHDGIWAVIRQAEMHREIKDLQFPSRWSGFLNHGYGYPLFLFTYPLPYYLGEIFRFAGLGVINTVKLLFILSVILSGVFMFFFARDFWDDWGGLLSTALFLYAPYRMVNLFIRGALGELLAWSLFPLIFLCFHKLTRKFSMKLTIITSLICGFLILTHNASALLFAPFGFSWWFFLYLLKPAKDRKKFLKISGLVLILGLGISASFWLPVVAEKKYLALSLVPLADKMRFFVPWQVLLGRDVHPLTKVPLHIGSLQIILFIITAVAVLFHKSDSHKNTVYLFSGMLFISVFLLFPQSLIFWQLPLLKEIDFPYRVLGIVSFLIAFAGGGILKNNSGKYLAVPVILLCIYLNLNYIKVQGLKFEPDAYYETNDGTTTSNDELMPVWVTEKPQNRPPEKISMSGGKFLVLQDKSASQKFLVTSAEPATLTANTLYFPGWKAYVNNVSVPVSVVPDTGLIQFQIPRGQDMTAELRFEKTPVRLIADIISVLAFIFIIFLGLCSKKLSRYFS